MEGCSVTHGQVGVSQCRNVCHTASGTVGAQVEGSLLNEDEVNSLPNVSASACGGLVVHSANANVLQPHKVSVSSQTCSLIYPDT